MSGSFREKNNGINYVFQPMFAKSGQLLAVECLSRFTFNSEYAHFLLNSSFATPTVPLGLRF